MLYNVKNHGSTSYPFKLTGDGFQFRFNIKGLIFFSSDALMPIQDVEFTPYYPTTEEQGQLLAEYQDWCTQFGQEQNPELIDLLTNVTQWKQAKLTDLSAEANKFEENKNNDMYFTSTMTFRCNGDRRTLTNIAGLISAYDTPVNNGQPVQYRDYDNQIQTLNKTQLETLYLEHLNNSNMLYQQKWEKEAQIDAAQTLNELNSVSLKFTMQDYSQSALAENKTTLKSILNL